MGAPHRLPRRSTDTHLPQKSHPRPQIDDITANLGWNPSVCVCGRWASLLEQSWCAPKIHPCCSACWEPPRGRVGASPPRQHSPSAGIFAALLKKSRSRKVSSKNNRAISSPHTHTHEHIHPTDICHTSCSWTGSRRGGS